MNFDDRFKSLADAGGTDWSGVTMLDALPPPDAAGTAIHVRNFRLAQIVAASVAIVLSCSEARVCTAESRPRNDAALDLIEATYTGNRQKFSAFSCKFQVTEETSTTLEDAIAGRIESKLSRNGLWIVGPDAMRYELDCPPDTSTLRPPSGSPADAKGVAFTEILCLPRFELWSRKAHIAVSLSSVLGVVNLKDNSGYSAVLNPLTLGVMGPGESSSPAALIAGSRDGSRRCWYKGEVELDGVKLAVIETAMNNADPPEQRQTWYLDLAQGAFPIRVVFSDAEGKQYGETRTLAVKKMPNAGFVAEHFLQTWTRDDRVAVIRVALTEMDLAPPSRDQLSVTINPQVQVIDVADMRSAFRTTREEAMYADDLEPWRQRCQETLKARLEENKLHGQRK